MVELNWFPQYWRQIIFAARFFMPVVLYVAEFSLIDIINSSARSLPVDLPNLVFAVVISGYYLSYICLTPSFYRAKNEYVSGVVEILLQVLAVEITLRLFAIPFYYVLHYLCIHGYVASFVNYCLFFLYTVDGKVPVSKFVRLSRTEEGFEIVRYVIADLLILWGLFKFGIPQLIITAILEVKNYFVFYVIPIFQELIKKDRKKSLKKKKKIFVNELELRSH